MTALARQLAFGIFLLLLVSVSTSPSHAGSEREGFFLSHEFYGPRGYSNPEAAWNVQQGMTNMLALDPPVEAGMSSVINNLNTGFNFYLQGASHVKDPSGQLNSASTIASKSHAAAGICAATGKDRSLWSLMIEWDQSGGGWVPNGRPRYLGLTRTQAYSKFTGYYLLDSPPLDTYLAQPAADRGCRLGSVSDYAPNAFYAFQMGVDVGLLERAIDELGDTSTGLAFMRGAGRLYDRPWGIDISLWRTSADSATEFNSTGRLIGGWSPSYVRRHLYIAYMGGAHVVQIEPAVYYYPGTSQLNPFGQMVKEYGNFTLTRHQDVGTPVVPMALMLDFYSGFDTKHGPYNQSDGVWYQDIPYSSGDHMINNFFKLAYPNHWLHGTTPNAPFSDSAGYKSFLASGGDPRPYEPMPTTRWGDTMDVTLNTASLSTLNRYKVIVLMGGVVIDARLRPILQSWVQSGGTLVVNASQVSAADESLLGVTLGGSSVSGAASLGSSDGTTYNEPSYVYRPVTLNSATVLATTGSSPLITSNAVGSGRVILTTPEDLHSSARNPLVAIGVHLFDWLNKQVAPAQVSGPPVEYLFNTSPGRLITTVINNSGSTWNGTITAPVGGNVTAVREYIGDTAAAFTKNASGATVSAQVAPYDVRVYAIEYQPTSGPSAAPGPLTLSVTESGSGIVTSNPPGINCGAACSATYPAGTVVTLTATPASGSTFTGWTRGCTGTAPCVLAANGPVAVNANFAAVQTPVPAPAPPPTAAVPRPAPTPTPPPTSTVQTPVPAPTPPPTSTVQTPVPAPTP